MYSKAVIDRLVSVVESYNGINDKRRLSYIIAQEFSLSRNRKLFYNESFAIKFCQAKGKNMGNTILSLSALQNYDDRPVFACIVTPDANYLMLINSTFIKKISHSSKGLSLDKVTGSFNGPNVYQSFREIENAPGNFQELFNIHETFSFQANLERLIESTNSIVGRTKKFEVTDSARESILQSVYDLESFIHSDHYNDLLSDLNSRVQNVYEEILLAASIDNVNVRGRVIEYLITDNNSMLKEQIIRALHSKTPLPKFKTEDKLGDFTKQYDNFHIEVDIKTKLTACRSCPKAYNVDKLLEFLAGEKAVYMIFLLGIGDGEICTRLCSVYDDRLIANTYFNQLWTGRNTRGVAQFNESGLAQLLNSDVSYISKCTAREFLNELINQ